MLSGNGETRGKEATEGGVEDEWEMSGRGERGCGLQIGETQLGI